MTITITYFVHGTTTDNEKGIATGQSQGRLSKKGKEQCSMLGKIVRKKKFDAVFCSDLRRAVESAKIIFGKEQKIIKDKRLREVDYGRFTGHPASSFKSAVYDTGIKTYPDGEKYKDVEKRMCSFLKTVKKNYSNSRIAIVSHQGPQLALEVIIKKKSWKRSFETDWRKKGAWRPGWEYKVL